MNEIEIKLFGAFRKYVPSGYLKIQAMDNLTVIEIKEIIKMTLQKQIPGFSEVDLISESALATETEVLSEDMIIDLGHHLALLPPVCGG